MSITVTSANVGVQKNALTRAFTSGAAVTVGYGVYLDASGYVQHAINNTTEAAARGIGIAIGSYDGETSIASGDRCGVAYFGEVEGFSGMTPGDPVYVDSTAGRLTQTKPAAGYARSIGYAVSATTLFVNPESGDPSST